METFENILSNQNDYMFQCDRKVLKSSFYFQHRNLACFDVGSKAPVHLPFKGAFTYPSQKISNKKQYNLQITNSLDSISGINQLEEYFWKVLGIFHKNRIVFPVTCLHTSGEGFHTHFLGFPCYLPNVFFFKDDVEKGSQYKYKRDSLHGAHLFVYIKHMDTERRHLYLGTSSEL